MMTVTSRWLGYYGNILLGWLATLDEKNISNRKFFSSFIGFFALSLLLRLSIIELLTHPPKTLSVAKSLT